MTRRAGAVTLTAAVMLLGAAATPAERRIVHDEGADSGPRILFHAGRPTGDDALGDALQGPALLEESGTLAEAVVVLRAQPRLQRIEVAGQAARRECAGRDCDALALRRATQDRDWLVSRGIEPARLRSTGYGATRPWTVAAVGFERNRRVELDTLHAGKAPRRPCAAHARGRGAPAARP